MFDRIHLQHFDTPRTLTSAMVRESTYEKKEYKRDNLSHAEFRISGSVDAFTVPIITDFAKEHLFHLQAFTIFHYKKGSYTRRKDYPSFLILYTYKGEGRIEYLDRTVSLCPGDGILINCMKPHYYEAETDWDVAVLHFTGPLAGFYADAYESCSQLRFHEGTDEPFHRNLEKLLSIYSSPNVHRDLRASHRLEEILLYLLMLHSSTLTGGRSVPSFIEKTIQRIEEDYASPLSLDSLAADVNISKYYLSREFKKYTGFSPHDYLIRVRLRQACVLLKSADLSCSEIGSLVGIPGQNNFIYLFRKVYHMTPSAYRHSPEVLL